MKAGVKMLCFDYLSVIKTGEDDVYEVLINNLTMFEGLDLSEVLEGEYSFLGFPFRINCDGVLVRVILLKE